MIGLLAHVVAAVISDGTAAILAVVSWTPPLWLRVLAPVALVAVAVAWVRWTGRPVKR